MRVKVLAWMKPRTTPSRCFESWPVHAAAMTTGQRHRFGWEASWSWPQGPAQGQGTDRLLLVVLLVVAAYYFDEMFIFGDSSVGQMPQNTKIRTDERRDHNANGATTALCVCSLELAWLPPRRSASSSCGRSKKTDARRSLVAHVRRNLTSALPI